MTFIKEIPTGANRLIVTKPFSLTFYVTWFNEDKMLGGGVISLNDPMRDVYVAEGLLEPKSDDDANDYIDWLTASVKGWKQETINSGLEWRKP